MSEIGRWLVAATAATVITALLFGAMTRLADGRWLVDRLVRIFPLEQTVLPEEDDCSGQPLLDAAITIEGIVGTRSRDEGFQPLTRAEIVGHDALGASRSVQVEPGGIFRFVTAFASGAPSSCPAPSPKPQRLEIRATGCRARSVPVTPAWVPHRVLLECEPDRG